MSVGRYRSALSNGKTVRFAVLIQARRMDLVCLAAALQSLAELVGAEGCGDMTMIA